MKVIQEGHPKKHWIYGVTIECRQCLTQYQIEEDYEFYERMDGAITTECPLCGRGNETHRPLRQTYKAPYVVTDKTWVVNS